MSLTIQGACADVLMVMLDHILDSSKMELRGHFHDSVYLACLCPGPHPGCKQSEEIKSELEGLLAKFTWPNTSIPVFKFGDIEWTVGEEDG